MGVSWQDARGVGGRRLAAAPGDWKIAGAGGAGLGVGGSATPGRVAGS